MTFDRKLVISQVKQFSIFIVAAIVQPYFMCPGCTTFTRYSLVSLFTFFLWLFLWKGNDLVTTYVSEKIPWMKFPLRRLFVGIISTIGYTLLAVVFLMEVFALVFDLRFGSGYIFTIYFSVAFTIVISLILHSRAFYLHWRAAARDAERYEKESIAAKYENLKSQVNPHFLFNTLNVLTNLVYEDQDKAVKFIKQLSEVYRHVLETRDKELISLQEERKFLDSYLFLQQIRFGDKLKLNINLNGAESLMPPLVLQMLIENAIKHNIIAEDDPLTISVYVQANFIVVENNLQKKSLMAGESPGVGLENIQQRYKYITDVPVEITQNEKFIVKLPIIPVS
ncbi:MAG TPA: histidine kinase [Ohtaekwangia sp.]